MILYQFLTNRHLIIEGHRGYRRSYVEGHKRSYKVIEGQGRSFPVTELTFQMRKVMGGWGDGGGGVVACMTKLSAQVPIPFLWTLDLGLGFGT